MRCVVFVIDKWNYFVLSESKVSFFFFFQKPFGRPMRHHIMYMCPMAPGALLFIGSSDEWRATVRTI